MYINLHATNKHPFDLLLLIRHYNQLRFFARSIYQLHQKLNCMQHEHHMFMKL